jgi:hypothetical protein
MVDSLTKNEICYSNSLQATKERVSKGFKGSIQWYIEIVKLDLGARKNDGKNTQHKTLIV